jgi:hypothetical protein
MPANNPVNTDARASAVHPIRRAARRLLGTLGIAMASIAETRFTGGCACGAIRYECLTAPLRMLNCHCRDCQIASGSAYSPTLIMARSAVRIIKGSTTLFEKLADSGNMARREFCATCGTPLFASSSARADYLGVKAASLDDPRGFKPEADVWVGSAQPWDCLDPGIPKFEKNRPRAK